MMLKTKLQTKGSNPVGTNDCTCRNEDLQTQERHLEKQVFFLPHQSVPKGVFEIAP